jgi:glycosyltransferase involved in cell wall biosynthesis
MKALLVSDSYWPNADGAALFERRLVLGLISLGWTMSVWAAGSKFKSFEENDGPYLIHRESAVTFWANRKYKISFFPFFRARNIIRTERPEIIHIHNCYLMGLSTMFWARYYRIPVVATNHFMPENALLNLNLPDFLYRPAERIIWAFLVAFHNRATLVTSPTPTAIQLLDNHGLRVKSFAITNGIDIDVFHPAARQERLRSKLGIPNNRPVILYVGRVDGEKRLDLLVAALPMVLKQTSAQLVIAGYGKAMDALKQQARSLGIADHVTFTGYLQEEDKPHLYNEATLFVISSPAELQSIVTLEAMASGLPIIATDVAALKELCHDGKNGFLFPENDVPSLAAKMITILTDNILAARLGKESMRIVSESHTTQVTFDEYNRVYQNAMKGQS